MKKLLVLSTVLLFAFAPADGVKQCDATFGEIYKRQDGTYYYKFTDGNQVNISEAAANWHCRNK